MSLARQQVVRGPSLMAAGNLPSFTPLHQAARLTGTRSSTAGRRNSFSGLEGAWFDLASFIVRSGHREHHPNLWTDEECPGRLSRHRRISISPLNLRPLLRGVPVLRFGYSDGPIAFLGALGPSPFQPPDKQLRWSKKRCLDYLPGNLFACGVSLQNNSVGSSSASNHERFDSYVEDPHRLRSRRVPLFCVTKPCR